MKNWLNNYKNMPYKQKTSLHNKISMGSNFAWSLLKLVLAGVISSFFLTLSGFYTMCLALAKCSYFDGRRNAKNLFKEEKYYKQIAFMLMIAGLIYLLYILEIFIYTHEQSYGLIISITFALIAFCEIFFSVRGLIKSWASKDLLLIGLKLINISSALSSLVLTQIALLSVNSTSTNTILYNTLFGMFIGLITMALGIYMFFYLTYFNKKHFHLIKKQIKFKLCQKKINIKSIQINYHT